MPYNAKNKEEVFRVDRFKVPEAARAEFTQRAHASHERLRMLPAIMQQHYREIGYDPGAALNSLGIEAQMAAYTELPA